MKKILLSLLALLAFAANAQQAPSDADTKYATELLKPGSLVPDFKLQNPDGKKKKISQYTKGHYTVVDFWASWCPDCRKDIPNIQRMYQKYSPLGVQFLGISFDDDNNKWKEAIQKYNLEYPQLSQLKRMRESEVAQAYGVKWIPSMMLLDKDGKVILSTVISDKLEKTLAELMAKEFPKSIPGTSEKVTIDGARGKLAGIIQKPELAAGQKCPIVMLCHGFGGRKEGPMFELIADSLAMHGIASIRFDFNGHGESEGEFIDMTVPNEIEDAKKVFEYVRDLRFVSDVAIVGHSQGGVVASMTAGLLEPGYIKAVALMAPAAILREDAIRGTIMGTYLNGDPLDPPEYVDIWGKRLGREYIKTAQWLPIYPTAAKYKGKAIIVHGTGDRVVPFSCGEHFQEIWPGSQLVLLDAFDHGFSQNIYRATTIVSDFLIDALK